MLPIQPLLLILLLLLPLASPVQADPAHSPILPDPAMTPGDVLTTDAPAVCQPGYAKSVRNVLLPEDWVGGPVEYSEPFLCRTSFNKAAVETADLNHY